MATRVRLPFEAASARTARRMLEQALAGRGASCTAVLDATLVLHELVVNGVDHGRPDEDGHLLVGWEFDEAIVVIRVHDCGTTGVVAAQPPSQDRARGRGLAIVDAISEQWSVVRGEGTVVSAWLRLWH